MFEAPNGCKMVSTVGADAFFSEYYVVSQNDNIINITLSPEHLVRALKCVKNADVTMKLIKKQKDPFLSFTLKTQNVSVVQDIPVIISPDQQEEINTSASQFDVNIMFPSILHVRNIAERFQKLSTHVTIAANQKGELNLGIRTEQAEVITEFKGLPNPSINYPDDAEKPMVSRDPEQFAQARVEIKHFLKFLNCYHLSPLNTVCSIVDSNTLAFFVFFKLPNHETTEIAQSIFFLPVMTLL